MNRWTKLKAIKLSGARGVVPLRAGCREFFAKPSNLIDWDFQGAYNGLIKPKGSAADFLYRPGKGVGMVLGGKSLAAAVLWILVFMGFPGEGIGELPSIAKKMQETLPVKIYRLILDPSSMQPVVLLTDLQEEKAMLIWIGPCEANAIQTEREKIKPPRPQTHDLAGNILVRTGWKIQKIVITHSLSL
jgi:hypothetical protein